MIKYKQFLRNKTISDLLEDAYNAKNNGEIYTFLNCYNLLIGKCQDKAILYKIYLRIAELEISLNNRKSSIAAYQKALEFKLDTIDIYYNIAITYGELKEYGNALLYYKKYVEKCQNYHETHFFLGISFYKLGLYQESIESFINCLELKKSNSIYYKLAKAYMKNGKLETALFYFNNFISSKLLIEKSKARIEEINLMLKKCYEEKSLIVIDESCERNSFEKSNLSTEM